VTGKSLTGGYADRLDELQVVLRRGDRNVTHVSRQKRQLGLDIGARAVPTQQGLLRKCMTKVMKERCTCRCS
jgi:hypothetical protein